MQEFQPTTSGQQFTRALMHSSSLFTPKRVGFTLAGAFVLAGAAAVSALGGSGSIPLHNATDSAASLHVQATTTSDNGSNPSDAQAAATASNGTSPHVHVTVNGQNVTVPENGSTQQNIPTTDGSGQSSVSVQSSTNGNTENNSSSSVSVNINSSSNNTGNGFSSSSTMVMQNGGSTFITSQ